MCLESLNYALNCPHCGFIHVSQYCPLFNKFIDVPKCEIKGCENIILTSFRSKLCYKHLGNIAQKINDTIKIEMYNSVYIAPK